MGPRPRPVFSLEILDVKGILRTAAQIGVKKYYVEDESQEAPEGLKTSLEYLKTVRF